MPGRNAVTRWSAAGAALCAGLILSTSAHAGAFAVREQSSYYQGMSFAGAAAGDDISAMFWNSAAAAAAPGINVSANAALVVPHREIEATGGVFIQPSPGLGLDTESGEIGDPTFVPASYANYQFSDRLFFGVGLNSQYGFTTKPDNLEFAGTPIATTSKIFSVTVNPNVAYKITPDVTVGVGVQVLYADVRLRSSNATLITGQDGREVTVDDWAVGATAGVIWNPMPGTRLGLGYRSRIEVEADGTCTGVGPSAAPGSTGCLNPTSVEAELTLPDQVTASFSQRVGERWRVLGTVEWTNWSLVGKQANFVDENGDVVDIFPLGYDDGWYFSGGVEYAWRPDTILRAGLGYEISPISDEARSPSLPDDERIWLSAGFSTKLSERTTIDVGYSHLFIDDAPICETEESTPECAQFEAEATGDIDIVTLGITHNFGGPEPELEPLK